MTRKPFALPEGDPTIREFQSGLDAWEQPFATPDTEGKSRTRGAVKTRGGIRLRGGAQRRTFALPENDPILKQFKTRLDNWERPFEKKR